MFFYMKATSCYKLSTPVTYRLFALSWLFKHSFYKLIRALAFNHWRAKFILTLVCISIWFRDDECATAEMIIFVWIRFYLLEDYWRIQGYLLKRGSISNRINNTFMSPSLMLFWQTIFALRTSAIVTIQVLLMFFLRKLCEFDNYYFILRLIDFCYLWNSEIKFYVLIKQ